MATTVIDKDGNLTVEVIEYDDKAQDGNGNRLVEQKQKFRVRREVLTKHSKVFAAMLRPSHWKEAQKELIKLEEDSVASMDIWFRLLHDTDLVYDVRLEEMWRLAAACNKYHFDIDMLKPWFATWYQKHDVNKYYENWSKKDKRQMYPLDPRSQLFPCWKFDHAKGFMRATHFLTYNCFGHITEQNPTIHQDRRVTSRVIQQLNAAKGRLRTIILNELFRANEDLLKAQCNCKEKTLFGYEKALWTINVWPLERAHQKSSMKEILDRLDQFSFEAKKEACPRCRRDYKKIVQDAQRITRSYFDGLCLDCMDFTKPVTGHEDRDYWYHDTLKVSEFVRKCRCKHEEPTWYFSFMGRRDVLDRILRSRRARMFNGDWDSD